jgi:hypothetical protein
MRKGKSTREKVVLIFGEDETDTKSIRELVLGLRPDFSGKIKSMRQPPIYSRGTNSRDVRSRVRRIGHIVAAEQAVSDVVCVLVHRDCDAVEPAHQKHSAEIETEFQAYGLTVVAVTPAWEFESWLFLWPDAVARYRPNWNSLHRFKGRHVGLISHAKEEFRRAVRAPGKQSRDYRESDAPAIARQARELGVVPAPQARSDSFRSFVQAVTRSIPDT